MEMVSRHSLFKICAFALAVLCLGTVGFVQARADANLTCPNPYIVDGDTLHCGKVKVRLYAIDAPELHGCPRGKRCVPGDAKAARAHLQELTADGVTCTLTSRDSYGRWIGQCASSKAADLSCAMVSAGHAVERYGTLDCE